MTRNESAAYIAQVEAVVNGSEAPLRLNEIARAVFGGVASAYSVNVYRWLQALVKDGKIRASKIYSDRGLIYCYYALGTQAPKQGKSIKERVVDALKTQDGARAIDVQRIVGTSFATVSNTLKSLYSDGVINRRKAEGTSKRARKTFEYFLPFFLTDKKI